MSLPRSISLWVSILACASLAAVAALASGPAPAVAEAAAPQPLIGYNDDFNDFELHRRNKLEDILPPGVPLVPVIGEEPPQPQASGAGLIRRARDGGADVVRYVVPWMRVERKRGYYDFSVDDQTYDLVLRAGLRPVIILLTSPCWAHPSVECNQYRAVRPDPQYMDDFARFAKAAIERYPQAAAIEVWNESNFKAFWGKQPSPAGYVRMLKTVDRETSGIPSRPPLLYNGLIPKPHWRNYLKRSYKRKHAGDYADGTGMHPYVGGRGIRVVKQKVKSVKKLLRRSRAPRRVWITEIGWSTNPEAKGAVGPAGQAARIEKLERVAGKMRLRSVIIHRLKDIDTSDPWEAGLGALRQDDSPKPLYCLLSKRRGASPSGC